MPSGGSPLAEAFHASVWRDQRNKVEEQVAFVENFLRRKQGQTGDVNKASVSQKTRGISTATAARARKIAVPSPALLGAMTAQMQQFSELVDAKVAEAEKRWSVQFKRLDERVKGLEGAFKLDGDRVTEALSSLQADVEKRDSRNVALMKKLHGIHAQELEDASAAVRKEQQSEAEGLHEDLRVQSRELIRLKASLDEVLAQHDSTSSRVASSIDDSLAALVSELMVRVGKLETKQYLRDGSPDSRGGGGGGGSGGKTRSSSPGEQRGVSSSREDRLELTALRESLGDLTLQLGDVEAEQSYLSGAVKSISASLQADKQKRQALDLSDRDEEIASLQKKINGVGKHASKAIRGLSEGMQDIQHSILAIYSWSNSVNAKLYLPLMDYQKTHMPTPIPPAQEGEGEGDEKGPHAKILAALQSANAPRTAEKWFDL